MSLSEDDKIRIRQALGLIEDAPKIRQALELIEKVADRRQRCLASALIIAQETAHPFTAVALGSTLAYSRSVDTLERVASELAGLLNLPPTAPDPPCPAEGSSS